MKTVLYPLLGGTAMALLAMFAMPTASRAQQAMTLGQCIDYALQRNTQVKQQQLAVKGSELSLNTARNARIPTVSADASQSFSFGRGLGLDNTYVDRNTMSTSLSVGASMPLFTGFRIPGEIKRARLNLDASLADLDKIREDLSIQVAQSFLQALYQKEVCNVAKSQVDISQAQAHRMRSLYDNQKASWAEVSEAQALVASDKMSLVDAQNNYKLALLDLSQLMEMPSPDSLNIALDTPAAPAGVEGSPQAIYDEAVLSKPAIKAEQYRAQSYEQAIEVARSGYWPTLSLSAGLGTSYYNTNGIDNSAFGRQFKDNFSKSIGLSLSIPIFDRFSTRNSIRQAKLDYEAAQVQLQATSKTLYKEIQQAWYNAVTSSAKYASSLEAEKSAEVSFNLMEKKYENGKANATEYAESKAKRAQAAYQRLQSLYEYVFRLKILDFYRGRKIE